MQDLLKIYTIDNDKEKTFLRKKSLDIPVLKIKENSFQSFLDDMIYTAKNIVTDEGYIAGGLAAVQVGKHYRVFCILKDSNKEMEIMINPTYKPVSPIQVVGKEACFSIPHIEGKVARFKKIRVVYLDRNGKQHKKNFSDYEAREIQHEYDHLEGVLFTDKLID